MRKRELNHEQCTDPDLHEEHGPEAVTAKGTVRAVALDRFLTVGAVVVLFVVFSITAKNFFTMRSVLSLLLQTSTTTLMGIGVTFTIITAGIDLSIGSVVALTGTVAVMAAIAGVPIWISWLIGVAAGGVCGLANGLLITKLKLPPFIATLGMTFVIRGVALTITNANAWPAPESFGALGNDTIFRTGQPVSRAFPTP